MSETKEHGYDWSDLRERPATELAAGGVFLSGPGAFRAYFTGRDGRVRPAVGYGAPGGTAWTVTARDGNTVTARGPGGGETRRESIPEHARVLVVEPVGTVLAVNSHRARERLERALGRRLAAYYDRAMRRGGKFVVLYGDDVATALDIKSVSRTRLKPEDVALCMGSTTIVDDKGLHLRYDDSEHTRGEADRAAARKAVRP